jgi:hypothetical protein
MLGGSIQFFFFQTRFWYCCFCCLRSLDQVALSPQANKEFSVRYWVRELCLLIEEKKIRGFLLSLVLWGCPCSLGLWGYLSVVLWKTRDLSVMCIFRILLLAYISSCATWLLWLMILCIQFVLQQYDNPLSQKLNDVVNEIRRQRCSYLRYDFSREIINES